MFPVDLPYDASATLLWLPENQCPKDSDFVQVVRGPAQKRWLLHEAIIEPIEWPRSGKHPWIKSGDTVFDVKHIGSLYPMAKRVAPT
jgi:hypothetical protein